MFTPPSSVKELLDLAHRHEAEETEFATFLENLRQLLRRPQFPHDGSAVSLAEYLDGREAQGAARLPGDEQSVVVLLVRQLLEALGYSAADAIYNRPLPGISERAVPDFTVFVRDLLGSTPVFLVECKSTSVAHLSGPGLEQGAGETAVRQLRRYVLSGVVHGRLGLLCNGFRLEAWEYGSEGDTRLVQVDLHALARQAAGEAEAFSGELRGGLRTVWYRFSRSAFVRAHDLQRVSAQEMAIDVSDSPKLLVDSLHGLIGQFAEDVLHQLGEGLKRHEEHEAAQHLSLDVAAAFQTWAARVSSSVLVGAAEAEYRREFSRQTAYVYVVRLLLVRICEDKKLFQRKISDGGLTLWQGCAARYLDYASGRSYEYLTRMAYECAQNVYVHFYGASELFDWYRMDEKMMVRALLVLNAFNLEAIDTDIIGAVYGRYLEEGKHEQGRYYTPRELVRTMLDLVGYRGEAVVNRRIADLACGSGSFLVEACRRLLDQFRGSDGKIPAARLAPALEEVQKSLYGVEINPFACYLAETNLLIQVLDLVRQAQETESTLTVERFRIYSGDSLLVDPVLAATKDTTLLLLGEDRAVLEQLKARVGPFEGGFDFLVGNPPYVRADEDSPSYLAYRRLLDRQDWFTTGHLKWDLYVPFVEQYHRLLADQPKARCCLVTIESLTNAPYAAKLRQLLGAETTLHDVLFTQGLRLFEDATWQNNVVFCFSRGVSSGEHRVQRRISRRRADDGSLLIELMDQPDQKAHDPDALFRLRERVDLDLKQTVRWEEICYVSVGMVLNSDEKREEGAVIVVPSKYDPQCFGEELVKNLGKRGKRIRHRRFKREELLSNDRDTIHTRPYLDSREVLRGGIGRIKWLEYGPHTRVPARVRRPTFPELYDRPKVVFGSFIGVAVDDGSNQEFLVAPHNVRISILWWRMADIENRALDSVRTALDEEGRYDSALSRLFSEWYLCALALSEPVQRWLHATRRSMKDDVYPDDIRAIPVKRLSQQDQQPFVRLEQERHRLWRELIELEGRGFRIGERVRIPVRELEEQEKAVRRRQARIEEIQAEIDRRAWDLYRPGGR